MVVMLDAYRQHNLFREGIQTFERQDPHLDSLKRLPFVHPLDWWHAINWSEPGILILTGGRQVGKSTSLKLLIKERLREKSFNPDSVFYLPCDQVMDHQHLTRIVRSFLETLSSPSFLLLIDEVTYVTEWDRSIKALADEGWFRRGFCILTGSDSIILKEAAVRFPGRRGRADRVDFHLSPLSFHDYVALVDSETLKHPQKEIESLFRLFGNYLQCGGYLPAINDLHGGDSIRPSTYATFEQWIRGDFLKRGKKEETLLDILQTIFEIGVSQASPSGLTQKMGSISKETFLDYLHLLERMDVLFSLEAYDQNRHRGFPKKARKFHFWDPFIRGTVEQWLRRERRNPQVAGEGSAVEACVAAQYRRVVPTYYWKGDGEIDLVLSLAKGFLPIEVKWSQQLRPHDLKELKKHPRAVILGKDPEKGSIEGIQIFPLPWFLATCPDKETVRLLFLK